MAKIKISGQGRLLSVEKLDKNIPDEEYRWRERYIDRLGALCIMESEKKRPGETFLYLRPFDGGTFKTGYGTVKTISVEFAPVYSEKIQIETAHSRYTFLFFPTNYETYIDRMLAKHYPKGIPSDLKIVLGNYMNHKMNGREFMLEIYEPFVTGAMEKLVQTGQMHEYDADMLIELFIKRPIPDEYKSQNLSK